MSLLILLVLGMLMPPTDTATLDLTITGLKGERGSLNLALFPRAGNFPEIDTDTYTARIEVTAQTMTYRFTNLPRGRYALAVYQDLNNNGKMDKNLWGVPTEPYAFSGGAVAKWKAPDFADAAFELKEAELSLIVTPKTWGEW
ncbi:MAG: DUF2141 domain-containing protein [Bacteroidetes bacterium]|nr:MAG: DUF2141 domain-containing protein [Bacteroidota bacterium]